MNFGQLMKQAQQMQKRVDKQKKILDEKEYPFSSQGNLINGVMKGNLELMDLHIDSSLLGAENKDDLEALLVAALNQAMKDVTKEREDTLNKITNGVDVSSFF
jgi:DNA-binding YbaB/EbfC family protein